MRREDVAVAIELLMQTSVLDIRPRLMERLTDTDAADSDLALIAQWGGAIVGAGKLTAEPAFPGTASALVAVHQDARGRGIGTELARQLDAHLKRHGGGTIATCAIRDDIERGREFAKRFGFAETNHNVGWRFDLAGRADDLAALAAQAAETARVRILAPGTHAEKDTVVHLIRDSLAGLPIPFGEEQGYEPTRDPHLVPDGSLVVLAEPRDEPGRVCGVSVLAPETDNAVWHIHFTGVVPGYRRRGVAAAVKTASMAAASQAGVRTITAVNDDTNTSIRRINEKLGMTATAGYWSLARQPARSL
jgi:GNAT superfamily N-acetyltransferase